jgi:2TM domain
MPPRWSRIPDRKDADYRQLDDRITFATHVALFAASNSVIWFFQQLQHPEWTWTTWFTGVWAVGLASHAIYIFGIADYSTPTGESSSSTLGGDDP